MLETSERKTPSAETLLKVAQGTGTTVEYLLTGVGPRPTEASVRAAFGIEATEREEAPADAEPAFQHSDSATGTDGVR